MPATENKTPYSVATFGMLDANAREYLVLVVSASFDALPASEPQICDQQLEISAVDLHRGDPTTTSVCFPGQMALGKPACDILITGNAIAPQGRAVTEMIVGIQAPGLRKTLLVSGDRFWKVGLVGRVPSAPRPFNEMPVIYERAFGGGVRLGAGRDARAYDSRNPIGVGLAGTVCGDSSVESELPNVELADDRQTSVGGRHRPGGFGPIGPGWEPRIRHAGTYDSRWLENQAPLLPHDFRSEFFQAAPADQQVAAVGSSDRVRIVGMSPSGGSWDVRVPELDLPVTLLYRDRAEHAEARVDTVHFEPNIYRVHLTARSVIPLAFNRAPLAAIVLGDMAPARIRARFARKVYRRNKVT